MTDVEVQTVEIANLQELYDAGDFTQAFRIGTDQFGALGLWPDQVLAGRVAVEVGSPRARDFLHLRAGRLQKENLKAQFYAGLVILRRLGPWRAQMLIVESSPLFHDSSNDERRAEWLGFQALVHARFRDFQSAHMALGEAKSRSAVLPWFAIVESELLEAQDRIEEALAVMEFECNRRPWHIPSVRRKAALLESIGRDTDALDLLTEAEEHCPSLGLSLRKGRLLVERGQFSDALGLYQEILTQILLPDKGMDRWLNSQLFRCHYNLGEREEALQQLGGNPAPKHRALVENLRGAKTTGRVKSLAVGWTRQHHETCAPATLTALANYWGNDVDHVALAREICYDGTSGVSQRRWAEDQGWLVREFTLDWESAVCLIDRGLPFALRTMGTESGHLQAVIGYDENLGTLKIREWSFGPVVESLAADIFKEQDFFGPEALVLVPPAEGHRLDFELPDSQLYALRYALECALEEHNRARAEVAFQKLQRQAPGHRITLNAEFALAIYDENQLRRLQISEILLERYTSSDRMAYEYVISLHRANHDREGTEFLQDRVAKIHCDPMFIGLLAEELLLDAGQSSRANRCLLHCLSQRPRNALFYSWLGKLRQKQGRFGEALHLRRIASCLDDKNEELALEYFSLCAQRGQGEQGLGFLRDRYERLAHRHSDSGRSLFTALERLGQTREAHSLLSRLLKRFPADSSLAIFAADAAGRYGRYAQAESLLENCRLDVSELTHLRARAKLESQRGDLQSSAKYWKMVAKREPSCTEAHRSLVSILETMGEAEQAADYLEELVNSQPKNVILHKLYCSTLARFGKGHSGHEEALRRLLQLCPKDAWAWRRFAMFCEDQGRYREADQALEESRHLDPQDVGLYHCLAIIAQKRGHREEAQQACRDGIRSSLVEASPVIEMLFEMCVDRKEDLRELDFLWSELLRQKHHLGSPLQLYQELAEDVLNPSQLLAQLKEFSSDRPTRPENLLAVVRQARKAGCLDEALSVGQEATELFPHNVPLWLELSEVHAKLGQDELARACLDKGLAIEPANIDCCKRLADLHFKAGSFERARDILKQGLAISPDAPASQAKLAEAHWACGAGEAAIEALRKAICMDSSVGWGWKTLASWTAQTEGSVKPLELARELLETEPSDPHSWLNLARQLPLDACDEKLEAVNKALHLAPLDEKAHDLKICFLAQLGRWQEALEACHPEAWGGKPPLPLRGRKACLYAEMGELDRALVEMEAILKNAPHYSFGRINYCQWLRRKGHFLKSLEAAESMCAALPELAVSHATLGWAYYFGEGDPREPFRRAIELDSTYPDLVREILEEDLEREDLLNLKRDLDKFRTLVTPGEYLFFSLGRVVLEKDWPKLGAAFQKLCDSRGQDNWIGRGAHFLTEIGKVDLALEVLRRCGASGKGPLCLGSQYGELLAEQGPLAIKKAWDELPKDSEFSIGLLAQYISEASPSERDSLLETKEGVLRSHDCLWAAVATSLFLDPAGALQEMVDWTDDWKQREHLEAVILFRRSVALRALGRRQEAHQLALWCHTNLPPDNYRPELNLILALGELESGHLDRAHLYYRIVDSTELESSYQSLYPSVGARLSALTGRGEEAAQQLIEVTE